MEALPHMQHDIQWLWATWPHHFVPHSCGTMQYDCLVVDTSVSILGYYVTILCDWLSLGTVRYGTVRYGTVRYGTVPYGTGRDGTARAWTGLYRRATHATRTSSPFCSVMVRCAPRSTRSPCTARVRSGTVRYGTVRYGTVRYGTVRYDHIFVAGSRFT